MSSDYGVVFYENDLYSNLQTEWGVDHYYLEPVVSDGGYDGVSGSFSANPAVMLVVLAVIVGIVLTGLAASLKHNPASGAESSAAEISASQSLPDIGENTISAASLTFAAPYTKYVLTQGIHGSSYGQMAIDIAAGRGEPILSPINGLVTQLYMDEYGSPTLVIENEAYAVTFLHGDYAVAIGDELKVGQPFGAESNKGYTMDMAGNLCYNREWCGNHSHLNVYDKRIQANVNPLDLIGGH